MTFVFPVLLGGLALAGVPVLLHLIMRQKPKTLPFPAFRFLKQRQRTNLRKLQLRHLLLLALRILLIVLLCLALGRPRLFNQGLNLSSERPVAAVLVFDTSLSMEYQTSDKRSRLDEAKKRGQEFLNELPDGSRVVILDSADAVASNRGAWLVSMSEARKRITELVPRPNSVSALQTVAYAYRILGELARDTGDETGRYLPRFVCVFSDRTRASWDMSKQAAAQTAADQVAPTLEGLQQARAKIAPLISLFQELRKNLPPLPDRDYPEQALIDSLEQLSPLLPSLTKADFPPEGKLAGLTEAIQRRGRDLLELVQPKDEKDANKEPDGFRLKLIKNLQDVLRDVSGAQGLFIDVGIDKPVDLAITQLELPAAEAGGQARQVFSPDEKFLLRALVEATGQDLSTTLTCKLDNNKIYQQPAEVKAGERQTIPIEIDCQALKLLPGPHQVEVRLDPPDLLMFNNRFYLTFAIRQQRRLLVLREDKDAANAGYFINALEKNGFVVDAKAPHDLPDFGPYQTVYLFEVPAPTPQLWNYLLENVQRGISLGIIPGGQEMVRDAYNSAAAQKVMPGHLGDIINHGKDDGLNPGAIWDLRDDNIFQHPFMRPFRGWQEYDLVTKPRGAFAFWDVDRPTKDSLVIVRYPDKDKHPAVLERQLVTDKGKPGKVLLFTTPLDVRKPRWNNYLENSMFVGLSWLATNYLAGAAETPKLNFLAGRDEPAVTLPPSAGFLNYALLKERNFLEKIAAADGQSELKPRQAEAPGNYIIEGLASDAADNKAVAAFSVNVPAEESDLSRVELRYIESLFGPSAVIPVDRQANIRDVLKGHWSEPFELFPLLMVVVLIVLAVENLLANKFYRRDSETAE